MAAAKRFRFAIDRGGTFTDVFTEVRCPADTLLDSNFVSTASHFTAADVC